MLKYLKKPIFTHSFLDELKKKDQKTVNIIHKLTPCLL